MGKFYITGFCDTDQSCIVFHLYIENCVTSSRCQCVTYGPVIDYYEIVQVRSYCVKIRFNRVHEEIIKKMVFMVYC